MKILNVVGARPNFMKMATIPEKWDGKAAERIAGILIGFYSFIAIC